MQEQVRTLCIAAAIFCGASIAQADSSSSSSSTQASINGVTLNGQEARDAFADFFAQFFGG